MSRARLYVLIDAFEADLRASIEKYLLDHLPFEEVFSPLELERAKERSDAEGNGEEVSGFVHYLDLQVAIDILLRFKERLPHELTLELTASASDFPKLAPIRHRVMHGRPLLDTDPMTTVSLLSPLRSRHWPLTKKILRRLQDEPAWEPLFEKQPLAHERTLHNLPEVDYDETSFVGRKPEREKLLDALKRRRNPVTTLTGEGGIGKTALALEVAYQLLDSADNPYEAILWVSLKTEKLTAFGVEVLRDAIRGIDNTILALGQGLSADFAGSLRDLAEALDGIEALIIIDNLESAHGAEIVEMYDALPASVTYLFTSRWGIGQLERTFPVPPLSEGESELLLRKFATARRQRHLAALSPAAARNTVEGLRRSPLAIRWFVLASEAGRVPLETLRDQSVLLEFCVKNVVDTLSDDSRAVLTVLRSLDRSIGFDEFAVLTEMSIDALRRATQELTRGSLVVVEAETAGAIAGRLALTATARMYLPRPDVTSGFLGTVRKRERDYRAALEGSAGRSRGFGNVTPRDSNDRPAVFLLESAQNFARSGNLTQARGHIERARSFNPEFSEIYRVSARLRSQEGQHEAAVSELQSAIVFATDDGSRARAHYDTADITSRHLRDLGQALHHARVAYDLDPCAETAFLLGKILIWTGEYKEGQAFLQEAHDGSARRMKLYVSTVIVDGWGRWAEAEMRDHEYESALVKALGGFHVGRQMFDSHPRDQKLCDALAECSIHAVRAQGRVSDAALSRHSHGLRAVAQFIIRSHQQVAVTKSRVLRDSLHSAQIRDALGGETKKLMELARASLGQRVTV